ncbi:MAG: glycosyltransferase [Candidatus Thorarchaeota archaeon]|jgi:glycosyltransferase involved in cell wall biosynthesis
MENSPLISVITPIHTTNHKLTQIRKAISSATNPIELIIVLNNPELIEHVVLQNSNEQVLVAPRKGRGFAFLEGIANSSGSITLLLHSDTVPPIGWDNALLSALEDTHVVGGGFSMTYGRPIPNLDIGIWIMNQWFRLSGELYGDRAMFVRSHILKRCLSVLEVSLFEDLQLAKCMRKHGRLVLLKEKVETGTKSLREYGLLRYLGSFLLCRFWYALGGSPFHIYNAYYPDKTRIR